MLNNSIIDDRLRALAEPTRRTIVERLSQRPASASDLGKLFTMTLAAVVQHLQVLEESGLVRSEKIGRVRTYSLEAGGLSAIADWIAERRTLLERRLDRLGEILTETDPSPEDLQHKAKEESK